MSSDLDPETERILDSQMHGILVGHEVMPVGWHEYSEWVMKYKYLPRRENFKDNPADLTRVGWTEIDNGHVQVSTVFLGIDHGFGLGPSLWFETMVFGGDENGYCRRYRTWDEAKRGHDETVAAVREGRALGGEE